MKFFNGNLTNSFVVGAFIMFFPLILNAIDKTKIGHTINNHVNNHPHITDCVMIYGSFLYGYGIRESIEYF